MQDGHQQSEAFNKYPKLALGLWHGMPFPTFMRLFLAESCSFSWRRTDRAVSIFFASMLNSVLNVADGAVFARRVRNSELSEPPLFILGHWRTGTTLLHELLIRDPQFSYPTTFQCLAPRHFLLSGRVLPKLLGFLLPKRRPMDNMPVGWTRPQEDEFGLANGGVPSSYWYWLYPDRPCAYDHYLDLSGLSPAELERWKDGFVTFAKRVTMRDPRRLILKSPTHTARVKTLLELFPQAKFIHLVRDPQVMIPSTILTWRRLGEVAGITSQIRDDLPEYVLENFRRMDAAFESQRDLIPSENFFATRYEDLTANMITTVQQMYSHLGLGDFSAIRPHLEQYVEQQQGYRRNKFEPDAELRDRIAQSCNEYCQRYGYEG